MRDMITMKESDGHDVTVTDAERRSFFQVEVPIETINDFLRAGFVRQIGHDDGGAEVMFCLTDDGRDRGERAALDMIGITKQAFGGFGPAIDEPTWHFRFLGECVPIIVRLPATICDALLGKSDDAQKLMFDVNFKPFTRLCLAAWRRQGQQYRQGQLPPTGLLCRFLDIEEVDAEGPGVKFSTDAPRNGMYVAAF